MKEMLRKLIGLETRLGKEKGPFDLFALFSSDDAEDKWDLVVSATWIGEEKKEALDLLSTQLLATLKHSEFLTISKIVPLDVYDPRVRDLQRKVHVEHHLEEIRDYRFFGFRVDTIYVITCKLQIDKHLMRLMWNSIIESWREDHRAIESKEILYYLKSKDERVPNYAMDRILEYLLNSKCIRGTRFIDSSGVKEHGAMVITWVDPDCRATHISQSN
jgi:hypothetical protein